MGSNDIQLPFETLAIPVRPGTLKGPNHYRIYKNRKEYVSVEAASASEALKASGIKQAHRIERDIDRREYMLTADGQTPEVPVIKTAEPPPETSALPPPTDTPLSNDEVNRLLQG